MFNSMKKEFQIDLFKHNKKKPSKAKNWIMKALLLLTFCSLAEISLSYLTFHKLQTIGESNTILNSETFKEYNNIQKVLYVQGVYDSANPDIYNHTVNSEKVYQSYLKILSNGTWSGGVVGLVAAHVLLENPYVSKEIKEKILTSYEVLAKNNYRQVMLNNNMSVSCLSIDIFCHFVKNYQSSYPEILARKQLQTIYKIENEGLFKEYNEAINKYYSKHETTDKNIIIIEKYRKNEDDYIDSHMSDFLKLLKN